jgi:hypothetical protein
VFGDLYLNPIHILAATVIQLVIGVIWYSVPQLAGESFTLATFKVKSLFAPIVAAVLTSYLLASFIAYLGNPGLAMSIQVGFWLWVGFVVSIAASEFFLRGKRIALSDYSLHLIALVAAGATIALW